jgi:hypothetical protein
MYLMHRSASAVLAVLFSYSVMAGAPQEQVAKDEADLSAPMPESLPLDLPQIKSISVTTPSIDVRSDAEKRAFPEAFSCDDFRVSLSDMETYFALTERISDQDYMHAIYWVPCQAFGKVEFADGKAATWGVMMSSGGVITFEDHNEVFLYCSRCTAPFVP